MYFEWCWNPRDCLARQLLFWCCYPAIGVRRQNQPNCPAVCFSLQLVQFWCCFFFSVIPLCAAVLFLSQVLFWLIVVRLLSCCFLLFGFQPCCIFLVLSRPFLSSYEVGSLNNIQPFKKKKQGQHNLCPRGRC